MRAPTRRQRGEFEAITISNDTAEVELVPARGGIVTRYAVRGDEVLYLDEATLFDRTKNVRGGIPLLFPIAGRAVGALAQHGFARHLPFEVVDTQVGNAPGLHLRLPASDRTRAAYPYEFALDVEVSLEGPRLRLSFDLKNRGAVPMPWHFGLHPYFRIPVAQKARASVETSATRAFDNVHGRDVEMPKLDFSAGEVDLHLLDHREPGTLLHRGDGSTVRLAWSPQFKTLVLWTLRGRDFVCVEPWTAPGGALERPEVARLGAGETVKLQVTIELAGA